MQRRQFLGTTVAGPASLAQSSARAEREPAAGGTGSVSYDIEAAIERFQPGKPHKGKMLAAIQPHCDDIAIFAAGTVLKLIDEGYTAYLITVTDDSMAGIGTSYG